MCSCVRNICLYKHNNPTILNRFLFDLTKPSKKIPTEASIETMWRRSYADSVLQEVFKNSGRDRNGKFIDCPENDIALSEFPVKQNDQATVNQQNY